MTVSVEHYSEREHRRELAQGINQLFNGQVSTNNEFTCTASQATTVVKDFNVGKDSVILFMPLTANAAAELATMYIGTTDIDPRNNQFTVNHANNAQTDRDFRYIILGQTRN